LRPAGYNTQVQIAQSRGYVVLMTEMIHDARVIPLAKTRPDFGGLARWQGNSWGRWEVNTLVIEKITPVGPKAIRYEFTVSDPRLWDEPWGGEFPVEIVDDPVFEYTCHEGKYGLPNTLRRVREEEKSRSSKQ